MNIKNDPLTGEQFYPKRRNQVFATSRNRKAFHNEKASVLRQIQSPINKYLEKNLIVLNELVGAGEIKTISKEELMLKGYNPNVFTHIDMFQDNACKCLYHFVLPTSENTNYITVINRKK